MKEWNIYEAFKKYQVGDCKTHEDFLRQYYKPNRLTETLMQYRDEDFIKDGLDWISRHDSVTGRIVSFYSNTCEYEFDGIQYWLSKEVEGWK